MGRFRAWFRRINTDYRRHPGVLLTFAIFMFSGCALYLYEWNANGRGNVSFVLGLLSLGAGGRSLVDAWRWRRFWKEVRRIRAGRCWRCNYDLRASAEDCPECGAKVPAPEAVNEAEQCG